MTVEVVREDERFVIYGVPWAAYSTFRDALDEAGSHVTMTYVAGSLELLRPSLRHCEEAKLITRMLWVWAEHREIDLRGFGGTTFRSEAARCAVEADDCFTIGPMPDGGVPHLTIDVVASNAFVDKISAYRALAIGEVWSYDSAKRVIDVRGLVEGEYERAAASRLFPDLDLALLLSFVVSGESHIELVSAYRAALTRRPT